MVIFNENIYFCREKKFDEEQKPADIYDTRWFGVLVLVDYCLV